MINWQLLWILPVLAFLNNMESKPVGFSVITELLVTFSVITSQISHSLIRFSGQIQMKRFMEKCCVH